MAQAESAEAFLAAVQRLYAEEGISVAGAKHVLTPVPYPASSQHHLLVLESATLAIVGDPCMQPGQCRCCLTPRLVPCLWGMLASSFLHSPKWHRRKMNAQAHMKPSQCKCA